MSCELRELVFLSSRILGHADRNDFICRPRLDTEIVAARSDIGGVAN
ncbi:hypothetical protein [Jiangella asiatica]|nr:hypothetical protein [Jiangella asiatica]